MSQEKSRKRKWPGVFVVGDDTIEELDDVADALKDLVDAHEFTYTLRLPCEPGADNTYFAKDVEIEYPDGGIELRHGEEVLMALQPPDVEIVVDDDGAVIYISVPEHVYDMIMSAMEQGE